MPSTSPLCTSERLVDASVVVQVLDFAGARHEVLPPLMSAGDAELFAPSSHRAPPPI